MKAISKWARRKVFLPKEYRGLVVSFVAAFVIVAAFMWSWHQAGYSTGTASDVVGAFSSLLVALSALLIGQGLRQRQEESANARAQLALNVELITRVLPHQGRRVLEVEVRVKNVSSKGWNLPMVYVFVHPVGLSNRVAGPSPIWAPEMQELKGLNVARFANTMTRLCPDEEEVFSKAYLIDEAEVQKSPYFLVLVEAIGAPDSKGFGDADREDFDVFMNGGLKTGEPDPALNELLLLGQEVRRVRDTYMVIETTERELCRAPTWLPRRVLIVPPNKRNEGNGSQVDRIDKINTERFRTMLDDTMMWSRSSVVCVGSGQMESMEVAGASVA